MQGADREEVQGADMEEVQGADREEVQCRMGQDNMRRRQPHCASSSRKQKVV